MKPQRIEISYKTVIFIALFGALLAALWQIRSIIIMFFVCFMFMEALNPTVTWLEHRRVPRPLGIAFLYVIILSVISLAVALIIPILVEQTTGLISSLPSVIQNINIFGYTANSIDWASQIQILENLPSEIAKFTISLFSNIFSAFVFFVVTFYMLIERQHIQKYSFKFFGQNGRQKVIDILDTLEVRLGHWVNAELLLMTVIGLLSYIGYSLIGIKYAVPLALVAGLLEAVPNIGPTVATILAAVVGMTVSPIHSLLAVILGIFIQQLENNFIVPKIMKETVGLNPLVTILVIAIGAKLAGVGGAVLAVPVYLTVEVLIHKIRG